MTLELFTKIIQTLKSQSDVERKVYSLNIDLIEFVDPYQVIISDLISNEYGKEAKDWWDWFLYECDYGQKDLEAWDQDNNRICYDIPSLWQYMELLKKESKDEKQKEK